MLRFEEAQDLFHKWCSSDAAVNYHRAAWRAYLANRIDDKTMGDVMRELEAFWDDTGVH